MREIPKLWSISIMIAMMFKYSFQEKSCEIKVWIVIIQAMYTEFW